ncbi:MULTISPECIES: 2-oxo acid dehydrogenase subunit E2 [unclassified Cryobacterium]|uniref:2-oxo acid dehydrogenase subunit E2 n=1 Tax=unclassified Cryobacterium TaxID=2649013 RepID=UPI00106B6A21|nr:MULTISPECIES: 2-oxo acid dehydrogenase subunit E2 [unclassified Cryobacterium]TFB92965.1 pyruvate dehydrogenase complex dihydrolipoamide acetyltransferase [Cryobacterium sp. MDB2-A-1]TFC05859.1 pyruvate dehydrogenase complex dihydrolipoamide acetyltransferase [Cryobacterium sp. MDB2-33-2]TFC10605.1 pyruvate dehydrogenase complex dihydrolipoamide acetyltransferase [Cryobacterium sp. MDB2-A-2]TFC21574.1 pyruvate dehydrogenase complex dihydrolipoamide acetyltransferase [Cryobacterium sp. MDB2-1
MATLVRMPEVLANAAEAAIQTWLVKVGDTVAIGQPLAEIETEKAVVEYRAETEGVLARVIVPEGVPVEVGVPIGVIAAVGEAESDIDAFLAGDVPEQAGPATPVTAAAEAATPVGVVPVESAPDGAQVPLAAASGQRQFASPLVRRIARERALDLSRVVGSGPNGRIVRRDLDTLKPAPVTAAESRPEPVMPVASPAVSVPAAPSARTTGTSVVDASGFTDVPHTGMRRAIARRLTESKSTVPHFYITADCRVERLLTLRGEINATSPRKISVNDFVVKAVAVALVRVPAANVIWTETATRRFEHVDLSVAVSTETGLLTPVLRGVEGLTLTSISERVADLAGRARKGKLRQEELEGGSFAVSNLGMFAVDQFSAILNPPQSGILAVGAAKQRPVVDAGQLSVGSVMTVTLSADHRVVDGAVAAEWMAQFVACIENPLSIII